MAKRLAKEKEEKEEAERLVKEKAAKEAAKRLAKEKEETEEAERLVKEKAVKEEAERLAKEKAKAEAERPLAKTFSPRPNTSVFFTFSPHTHTHHGSKVTKVVSQKSTVSGPLDLFSGPQSRTFFRTTRTVRNFFRTKTLHKV